ncbi:YciI family protein [Aminobacter sp. J44]|uniref:YciI family protein n=1 Tax=Aminobacter sp. J44 TaxID=935262 RepID=UPI00119AD0A4|nr:YciI family protein [Aminobacter sp. J44]TWG50055.1 hypothetical protein L610_000600000590 [Aminobacter sp. J44]
MIFTFIGRDKPGHLDTRLSNRPAHVEYLNKLNASGKLKFAGPLLGDDGKPAGSLVALEVASREEAESILAADPYAKAGLFESTELHAWNWLFNNPEA